MREGIRTNEQLEAYIRDAVSNPDDYETIYEIFKYKWYNYYRNTHVKAGSKTDLANEATFMRLEKEHKWLHDKVEELVDAAIEKENLYDDF